MITLMNGMQMRWHDDHADDDHAMMTMVMIMVIVIQKHISDGDGIRLESNGVEVYRQFQGAIMERLNCTFLDLSS